MDTPKKVLVCVTGQHSCERLIRHGAKVSEESGAELSVVHVTKRNSNILGNPKEGEALEYLFSIAKQFGADMSIIKNDDVLGALSEHARQVGAELVVLGAPVGMKETGFTTKLQARLPGVVFNICHEEMVS